MLKKFDPHEGLIKISWADVKDYVSMIEPQFAKIVNTLSPDNQYPLYLAFYPFGAMDADTRSSLFPHKDGTFFRISDLNVPKDVLKNLGYSVDSTPLGMVLDKELECFIDLKNEKLTIPWYVYRPGDIFPFARMLNKKNDRTYAPNGLLCSAAGARSAFMLPNIGSAVNHSNLQRDFNVQAPPPKSLYEHWNLFKEIFASKEITQEWFCCVMYFSEKWLEKIHEDKAWHELKLYLLELAWYYYEYERNRIYYDITFSMIQQKRNLKPNPYLTDTAKHLFATAMGAVPGYTISVNEEAIPLSILQKIFVESYGLKKYLPTIMQPAHFDFENGQQPIYYSLQNPSTRVFSPKSRQEASTLFEIRELEHIMKIFSQELIKHHTSCADTILGEVARKVKFYYFHNKKDRHRIVRSTKDMPQFDERLNMRHYFHKNEAATFASDAPFVRGCVAIQPKSQ